MASTSPTSTPEVDPRAADPGALLVAGQPGVLPPRHRPGRRPRAVVHQRRACRTRSSPRWTLRRGPQGRPVGGVGLAATFAGGTTRTAWRGCATRPAEYSDELALGSVFAMKARTYSDFVPEHTISRHGVHRLSVADALEPRRPHRGPGRHARPGAALRTVAAADPRRVQSDDAARGQLMSGARNRGGDSGARRRLAALSSSPVQRGTGNSSGHDPCKTRHHPDHRLIRRISSAGHWPIVK